MSDIFFIEDRQENKEVEMECCPTDEMMGDCFTEPLQGKKFKKFGKPMMGGFFNFGLRIDV